MSWHCMNSGKVPAQGKWDRKTGEKVKAAAKKKEAEE